MDYFVILMLVASTTLSGGIAFAVTHRDFRGVSRVAIPSACALLVGVSCLFIPYLPVFAFLGTVAAYVVLRRLFSAGLALTASGVLLLGGCSFSVMLMMAALETM